MGKPGVRPFLPGCSRGRLITSLLHAIGKISDEGAPWTFGAAARYGRGQPGRRIETVHDGTTSR
jgi:hypothetical protein